MGNSSSSEEEKRASFSGSSPNRKRDALRALQQHQQQQPSAEAQTAGKEEAPQGQDKIPTPSRNFDDSRDPLQYKNERSQSQPVHEEFVEHVESASPPVETAPRAPQPDVPKPTTITDTQHARPQFSRRKSAIVLETEDEADQMQKMSLETSAESTPIRRDSMRANDEEEVDEGPKFDCKIEWKQGGRKVYVTGSFTGWRKMIQLTRQEDGHFSTVLKLPVGTHRLRFVVDNEMRCSDYLQMATDSMGNFHNYVVVDPSGVQVPQEEEEKQYEEYRDDEDSVPQPKFEYCQEIPEVFTNPETMDKFVSSEFVTPPHLPPHLEGVILNSNSTEKDNNSVLPIPNHVVLNHLATTSIKHNVLAVASISRYSRKYVTQVLYAPL